MDTILTGNGEFVAGSALDNTQTDNFFNLGTDNTIVGLGGNVNVTGLGPDSATTVYLTSTSPASNVDVTDSIVDNGSGNTLSNDFFGMIAPITGGSTISFTVNGPGGGNTVSLTDSSDSTFNVTANGIGGSNTVTLGNSGGINTVSLGGSLDKVTLNGDATNTVTLGGGSASVHIGSSDDDLFGWSSTVTFSGTGNTLVGGDENFSVSGSTGSSTVHVGDGENTISMGGAGNTVSVWGGDNWIDAGGGGSHVTILGLDGTGAATPTDPDGGALGDDGPVPLSPTDDVTIAGSGDSVTATYENVNVSGILASAATITLGNGNNSVVLGLPSAPFGPGGNHVTVGNGGNSINVRGNGNAITVGDGANGVTLSGNTNTVTVNDPTGVGKDVVQLGAGAGDTVKLGDAAGSVTGTGLGTTTVSQSGPNAVTVNLNNGTGHITLGDGNDTVTANGGGTMVVAGNGNDTVTANGTGDTISLGNGSNTLTANGSSDHITLGNGANTITANGAGDTITVGNGANTVIADGGGDKFTFGNGNNSLIANGNSDTGTFGTAGLGGNNTLVATGSGDVWTFNENAASTVKATIGSIGLPGDTLKQTGGALNATVNGNGGAVDLTNVNTVGTSINSTGTSQTFDLTNSGGALTLNSAAPADSLTVNGVGNDYDQALTITNFSTSDKVDLEDLYTTGGVHISSFGQFFALYSASPTGTIDLMGGGSLSFTHTTVFNPANVHFS